jgi:hypothetical protein
MNKFIKFEVKNFDLELSRKHDKREGVDFLIGDNQLYLKSIYLDTTKCSI